MCHWISWNKLRNIPNSRPTNQSHSSFTDSATSRTLRRSGRSWKHTPHFADTIWLFWIGQMQLLEAISRRSAMSNRWVAYSGHNWIVFSSLILPWAPFQLAKKIAAILLDAFRKNILKIESVFVVGHSLGAQLGGIIGQHFKKQSFGTKLRRISGLDPAGPLFFPDLPILVPDNHLSEDDARFVDIVHTDCGGYGYPVQTGSADFYVNSGYRFQPGCGTENPSGERYTPEFHLEWMIFWIFSQEEVAAITEPLISGSKVLSITRASMRLALRNRVDGRMAGTTSSTTKSIKIISFWWAFRVLRRPTDATICKPTKRHHSAEAWVASITMIRWKSNRTAISFISATSRFSIKKIPSSEQGVPPFTLYLYLLDCCTK